MYESKIKLGGENLHVAIETASTFEEAVSAAKSFGAEEIFAVSLNSSLKETVRDSSGAVWYIASLRETVKPEGTGKPRKISYNLLIRTKSIQDAEAIATEYIKQGYDMTLKSIKETDIYDVI